MRPSHKILAAVAACSLIAANADAQTRVQILHASDLEGGVAAIADAPNFAAVVQALENSATKAQIPSLLLSAGDNYIPGPFFSSAGARSMRDVFRAALGNPAAREGEGRVDIAIMNLVKFDASAVGNHEFDAGSSTFGGLIGTDIRNGNEPRWLGAQFPYLSANLDFSGDGLNGLFTDKILPNTDFVSPLNDLVKAAAAPKLATATIIKRGTEMFGVVGGTTPLLESISSTGGVKVKNPGAGTNDMAKLATLIQPSIDALEKAGVNKIILVTHLQQFSLEEQLIKLLSGVDVVVAGGSDKLLADSTDRLRSGDKATGKYPIVTENKDKEPALIVSSDGQYKYVGRLVVSFDAKGVLDTKSVVAAESGAYATDDKGVIDTFGSLAAAFAKGTKGASVKQLTDAVSKIVTDKDKNVVGKASVWLEGRRTQVRTEETNFGSLSAIANLDVAKSFDKTVLVSHKNGGGIRNPIGSIDNNGRLGPNIANPISGKKAGEVSQLDIENTLRFNNGLTLITLSRAQMKEVLEHAVARSGSGNTPGQFGQFEGIAFSFDTSKPAGSRVQYAALTDTSVKSPQVVRDGKVVGTDPIRLVTLDFLANGGDSYPFQTYVTKDPTFAKRVDLKNASLGAGKSTFAAPGSEQDALAEYFIANFAATPYGESDSVVGDDQRIQQTGTRPNMTSATSGAGITFTIKSAPANSLVLFVIGTHPRSTILDFGGLGRLTVGDAEIVFTGAFHGGQVQVRQVTATCAELLGVGGHGKLALLPACVCADLKCLLTLHVLHGLELHRDGASEIRFQDDFAATDAVDFTRQTIAAGQMQHISKRRQR